MKPRNLLHSVVALMVPVALLIVAVLVATLLPQGISILVRTVYADTAISSNLSEDSTKGTQANNDLVPSSPEVMSLDLNTSVSLLDSRRAVAFKRPVILNSVFPPTPAIVLPTPVTSAVVSPLPQLLSDTVSSEGTVLPVVSSPIDTPGSTVALSDINPFNFVTVTLTVRDSLGNPIRNAEVKALSEDWGIRYPHGYFAYTDSNGQHAFHIPVGTWSFFAGAGWEYTNNNPGQGYFVILASVSITSTSVLTAQPEATTTVTIRDVSGVPLDGQFRLMDQDHIPHQRAPSCGRTQNGQINLHVTGDTLYEFLFVTDGGASPSYILHETGMPAGSSVTLQPTAPDLAHVFVQTRDGSNDPTTATMHVNYHAFNVGEHTGLAAVNFWINGQHDFYLSPGLVRIGYFLEPQGWKFSVISDEYHLTAGETMTLTVGGPLTVEVRTLRTESQIWLDTRDSYGHTIVNFSDDTGQTRVPIILTQDDSVIYTADIADLVQPGNALVAGKLGITYDPADSPDYHIDLNLGPMGSFNLTGTLLAPETLMHYETLTSTHFVMNAPTGYHDRFQTMLDHFEHAYDAESAAIGEPISGTTVITYYINFISAGFAYMNGIGMGLGPSLDSVYETVPSTFVGLAYHELGHVFQLSPPLDNYYITNWFGEPFATLLHNEAVGTVFGERLQFLEQGGLSHNFFDYLEDPELTPSLGWSNQFMLFYLRKKHGMQIHRDFVQLWDDTEGPDYKQHLQDAGFDTQETIITLYSCLAQENLAWLFQIGGFDIADERVEQGFSLTNCRARVYLPMVMRNY